MTLPRRTLLAAPFAAPALARASEPRRRILMILFRGWEEACDGFRDFFVSRGLPVSLDVRDLAQDLGQAQRVIDEAHATRPDLVMTWGTSTALRVLGRFDEHVPGRHLTGIPAVFTIVTDPVGNRLVRSADRPGRAVTGTEYIAPVPVQLRALSAYRPPRAIACLFNGAEQNSRAVVASLGAALAEAGIGFAAEPVPPGADGRPDPAAIPARVAAARADGADWLYIPPDSFLNDHRHALTTAALDHGLPSFAATERFVLFSSGLAGLVGRYYTVGGFAGFKAWQILSGEARAEDIPVEPLRRFSYLVRMEAARRLRLYPPVELLRVAEPV